MRRFDMHCHLDFFEDPALAAKQAAAEEIGCYSVTVTPAGYQRAADVLGGFDNVRVGLGLHPWWIADGRCGWESIEEFEALMGETSYIGEIGLDFGRRAGDSAELQKAVFERIIASCAGQGGKVISIHAVKSAGVVLDVIERFRVLDESACILHWFSGTSDELMRAIELGCYFSVGPQMLASRRGREYAKAIPVPRLLLETDSPSEPRGLHSFRESADLLLQAEDDVRNLRGSDVSDVMSMTGEVLFRKR